MDKERLLRASVITQRRTVERNFPPGPERDARLAWLDRVEAYGRLPISDALWDLRPKPR
jgi:hypothetical protein